MGDVSVVNGQVGRAGARAHEDAISGETGNIAMLDDQAEAANVIDAAYSISGAVDLNVAQGDDIACPSIDNDAGGEGRQYAPACPAAPSIVIALTIVTAPKPPGSRASISPPAAVFEMAPAKVLQGAVRLHGLASLPTPDTQVRVACA